MNIKPLLIAPALFLASCASHQPKAVVAAFRPVGIPVPSNSLRTTEQLREYRFGRYVDPGDPLAMHESHPVYRVETSAAWNLRGNRGTVPAKVETVSGSSPATNDAVVAEINRQRIATKTITEQATALNQRLAEMSKAASESRELAKQGLALKRDVAGLQERLEALDSQVRESKPTPTSRATPRPEDKW